MTKPPRYLLDVNALVALLTEDHVHHRPMTVWFSQPALEWALCPFTEAGLLRYMTRPKLGDMTVAEATEMLSRLAEHPGFHYQAISSSFEVLCGRFMPRLFGHNQITDAYLLGLAVRHRLILVTFDHGLLHLAGEHTTSLLLLKS